LGSGLKPRDIPTNQVGGQEPLRIRLIGHFCVLRPDGRDLTPSGQKARAILAMLALDPNGKRSRNWLQDKLWSESDPIRGRASLRGEIRNIRKLLRAFDDRALGTDNSDVWLNLDLVQVSLPSREDPDHRELLEGIDVEDIEFQNWAAEERAYWYEQIDSTEAKTKPSSYETAGSAVDIRPILPRISVLNFVPIEAGGSSLALTQTLRSEVEFLLSCVQGTFRLLDTRRGQRFETDYVLEASVKAGKPPKVLAMLRETATGETLWSERVAAPHHSGASVEESLARAMIEGIQSSLSDGYWVSQEGIGETSIQAWEYYTRARSFETLAQRQNLPQAIAYYSRAIELDPSFFQAKVSLGLCLIDGVRLGWGTLSEEEALSLAKNQLSEIPSEFLRNPKVAALDAFIQAAGGAFERAKTKFSRVLEYHPISPEMVAYYGALCGYAGDLEGEIAAYRQALSLTKHPPIWIWTNLALAHVQQGDLDVEELLSPVLIVDPNNVRALVALTVSLALSGRTQDAVRCATKIRAADPYFKPEHWRSPRFFCEQRYHRALAAPLAEVFARITTTPGR